MSNYGWLGRNSQGDMVAQVQGLLWQAGAYDGAVDGWYGPKTERAVKDWQKLLGATPDGRFGPQTLRYSVAALGVLNDADALAAGNPPVVPTLNPGVSHA